MDRRDDAAPATPLAANRRRRRRSSGAGDDAALDAMLNELGIPTSDPKKKNRKKTSHETTNPDDVIELITPPRPPRRGTAATANGEISEESKTDEAGASGSREDSILDLTTPTPPSSGKRARRASPRKSRQSIVNLLSPDGSEATESDDPGLLQVERPITPPRESEPEMRPRNLLATLERDEETKGSDEESEDERILRAITETQTGIQSRPAPWSRTAIPREARAEPVRALAVPSRDWNRLDSRSDEDEDNMPSRPPTKKRARQKKKAAQHKPAKEVILAAVALEKRLSDSPVGEAIKSALKGNSYNNKPVPFVLEPAFESDLNVIQFERRGGNAGAGGDQQMEDSSRYVIAMHYPAEAFLDLLADHGYDALVGAVRWLSEEPLYITRKRAVAWGSVVLIVEGMDRALIVRSKKSKAKSKHPAQSSETTAPLAITFSDLHQLAFRLFMDTSVHTKFTCDVEATASYVALLTREIIVAAVKQSSQEEFLESIPRVHSFRVLPGSGSTLNQFANTWLRMLQMIPGVSEDRAQSVLDHFPTFQSLLRAYNDPSRSVEEKEELLADKLHASRMESALSRRIFKVFSAWNERGSI